MATAGVSGALLTEISPTYISSDLLTPDQKHRTTIPAIGYHLVEPPQLGNETWGENVTAYGGIGAIPFMGKAKSRDLDVARNHLHFGSGFSKYPQKYVIPSNLPKHAYFSHISKNEVFPRHDPNRTTASGSPALTDNTSAALGEYYKDLYYTPRYHEVFPDNTEAIREELRRKQQDAGPAATSSAPVERISKYLVASPGPVSLATRLVNLLYASTPKEILDALTFLKTQIQDSNSVLKIEECLLVDKVTEILNELLDGNCSSDDNVQATRQRLREFLMAYRSEEGKVSPKTDERAKEAVSGVDNCWPPGTSYVMDRQKMQLKERESVLAPTDRRSPKDTPKVIHDLDGSVKPAPETNEDDAVNKDYKTYTTTKHTPKRVTFEEVKPLPGLPSYKRYLEDVVPVKFDNRASETLLTSDQLPEGPPTRPRPPSGCSRGVHPWQWKGSSSPSKAVRLPSIPLAESLCPTGNRIQDRLGLRFKAAAHRRYHEMYRDPVPDLRDSQVTRKRYFFYGYHASAFRG